MSKVVLITGVSSGFGKMSAQLLVKRGYQVFGTMRSLNEHNAVTKDVLESQGVQCLTLDVTSKESIDSTVRYIIDKAGTIDVLVNNAGVAAAGVSEAFDIEQMMRIFDVNVFGIQRMNKAVLPYMREKRRGLIINIGSILGRITFPFFGLYGASKFAVEAMTDTYRYELSKFGIDVALVQPSAFPTNMYQNALQPNGEETITDYGNVADVPGAMLSKFMEMFQSADAPDPIEVAKTVDKIIAAPKEERKSRYVVGLDFGTCQLNDLVSPIQSNTIKALGLEELCPNR